jgi:hypothetical protein
VLQVSRKLSKENFQIIQIKVVRPIPCYASSVPLTLTLPLKGREFLGNSFPFRGTRAHLKRSKVGMEVVIESLNRRTLHEKE